MTYIVLGSQEEGLYWEVGYLEGCYSEVLLYRELYDLSNFQIQENWMKNKALSVHILF